jgi:hypothetical protein
MKLHTINYFKGGSLQPALVTKQLYQGIFFLIKALKDTKIKNEFPIP